MDTNVGGLDRTARTTLGAAAGLVSLGTLAGAVPLPAAASPALGVGALALLGTAYTGFCGLYSLVGVDTCPADAADG